jgi:predicted lipoprotein with Yx(FWY)xxD motif
MDKPHNNTSRKVRRLAVLTALIIGVALAAALVFVLTKPNNNNNQSLVTDSDKHIAANDQPAQKTEEQTPVTPSTTGTVITTGDSQFGTMLFNEKKQAIYIWELEESDKAECYGDCAEAWPPVLTDGQPQATGGVNSGLLGTTKRTDGTTQVTYNGHPLYYYAHEGPGEVKCHNIKTHGGLWWVIQPDGNRAN